MDKHKILLLENGQTKSLGISDMLVNLNFDVICYADSGNALNYLKSLPHDHLPDLILSDTKTGNSDGIEFCSTVKKEISNDILFLFLLDQKSDETIQKIFEAGASDCIKKSAPEIEFKTRIPNLILLGEKNKQYPKLLEDIEIKDEEISRTLFRDELTKAYNRKYFLKELLKKSYDAFRYNTCFSLMMYSIDGISDINAKYGHLVGDTVMEKINAAIIENMRLSDILGRYDGNKFALILANVNIENAIRAASRFHKIAKNVKFEDFPDLKATISSGVAEYDHTLFNSYNEFLKKIIELLEKAKSQGCNILLT